MLPRPSFLVPLLAAWVFQAVTVVCGFDASAQNNLAVYWGQNSINRPTGQDGAQQRLSTYCSDSNVDVIPLAFLNIIYSPTTVNFANAGDQCTQFPGTTLLECPEIQQDIETCQAQGKTILLSIGGATYTEGGFSSEDEAVAAADKVWATFGPVQAGDTTTLRPFGAAVVDGFDLDFESPLSNLLPFARRLRALTAGAAAAAGQPRPPRRFYLTAAPQCFLPDAALDVVLSSDVVLDFVMVQFYNNWCGAHNFHPGVDSQPIFNLAQWDAWSASRTGGRTKILVGVPGRAGAAGSGYVEVAALAAIVTYARRFAGFAGVMVWDASQAWANAGWLNGVAAALSEQQPPVTTTATPTTLVTTTITSSSSSSSTVTPTQTGGPGVPQWGQCGGRDYTGPTLCQAPYKCVFLSEWWSSCQ